MVVLKHQWDLSITLGQTKTQMPSPTSWDSKLVGVVGTPGTQMRLSWTTLGADGMGIQLGGAVAPADRALTTHLNMFLCIISRI